MNAGIIWLHMTKKAQPPQGQDSESAPVTLAARITGMLGFKSAIVTAAAMILVALIALIGGLLKPSPSIEKGKLVVKVIDGVTRKNVKNARVS